jgi:hypothetical protein
LEFTFPGCLQRQIDGSVLLVCYKCQKPIDPEHGKWVAQNQDGASRGYHINQLLSKVINPRTVLDEFENDKTSKQLFYNHRLGLPYLSSDERLTMEQIYRCSSGEFDFEYSANFSFLGVDQGKLLHWVVLTVTPGGIPRLVNCGIATAFSELDNLMQAYNVGGCVIDGMPNQHSARDFARRHYGAVFLNYYTQSGINRHSTKGDFDHGDFSVKTNRTETLERMLSMIKGGEIIFPRKNQQLEAFARQLYNITRIRQEDPTTGEVKFQFIKLGEDHYAHALNYAIIAMDVGGDAREQSWTETLAKTSGNSVSYGGGGWNTPA